MTVPLRSRMAAASAVRTLSGSTLPDNTEEASLYRDRRAIFSCTRTTTRCSRTTRERVCLSVVILGERVREARHAARWTGLVMANSSSTIVES